MSTITLKYCILILCLSSTFLLSGCDNISDFLASFSNQQQETEENTDQSLTSFEGNLISEILDDLERQMEEAQYAKSIGDQDLIKNTYDEIIRLEQSYQEEFDKYESELSNKELLDISGRHQKIVRNITKFSSVMR